MGAFNKKQEWQHDLMNVLLDKQEWCSRTTVVASLLRLRMPEMPTPGQCTIRVTGVPGNHQSPSLQQSTLTQLATFPCPKRKTQ